MYAYNRRMRKRALVTGAAGFIGSNLTAALLKNDWHVDAVDDMSNGHSEFVPPGINFFYANDFSTSKVIAAINSQGYDVVFHLAAQPRVSYSVEHPVETHDINVSRTLVLLDACRGKVGRFVFASSSSVYGDGCDLPTAEVSPTRPQSPYAAQKYLVEEYLRLYSRLYGLDSAALRFFNVYGQNQLGGSPYSTAVSAWLTAIHRGESMRFDGDGTQSRDMVHVDDVVAALIGSASHHMPLRGEAFNVGTGRSVTNVAIRDALLARYPTAAWHSAPPRAGDVKHTLASVAKARDVFGYVPQVQFDEGLRRTIEWYESAGALVKGKKHA